MRAGVNLADLTARRHLLAAVLVLVAAFAAGCAAVATPSAAPDSGITGQVTVGPSCPVVQVNSPCPDKPFKATLVVTDPLGNQTVATLTTDADGKYRLPLPAGDYRLEPQAPNPGAPPQAPGEPFHLEAHQWLKINVTYDSGIR